MSDPRLDVDTQIEIEESLQNVIHIGIINQPESAWAVYLPSAAVRELNTGDIQIKIGSETTWRTVGFAGGE